MGTPFNLGIKIANVAFGIVGFLLAVFAILLMATPELMAFAGEPFSFPVLIAGVGFIQALYSGVSFRFIAEEKPRLAATVNAFLITVLGATIVITSSGKLGFVAVYLMLMFLVGFGSWMSVLASGAVNIAAGAAVYLDFIEGAASNLATWPAAGVVLSVLSAGIVAFSHRDKTARPIKPKTNAKLSNENITSDILIDAIADGVAIINKDGLISVFNPSAQKITGWNSKEAEGLDYRSVLVFVDSKGTPLPDMQNPISQSISSGKPVQNHEAILQSRSKKNLEIDVLSSPIGGGGSAGVITIFRDVSKQRSEERQRAEFISTASHEMRTPVAAIEGYLALALNNKVSKIDSAARGYLEKAHASTQHLGKLFQDLLTAAKSEDGRLTNNPEVVEVGQLLDELAEGVSFTAEKKGLQLKYDSEHNQEGATMVRPVAYVYVDPERIREVITNLFDNAVKYTEEGSISIGMQTDEKNVVITVADTGAGIPKEDIPHLFQKFYRVDNSATRQIGGTGLGLFISRKIVELYQGRIWVESDVGQGSTFFISLPRLAAEKAQELMKNEIATKSPLGQPAAASNLSPGNQVSANQNGSY